MPAALRIAAAEALSPAAPKEAAASLAGMLHEPDKVLHKIAVEGIGKLRAREYSDDVALALRSGDWDASHEAIKVLCEFGNRRYAQEMVAAGFEVEDIEFLGSAEREEEAAMLFPYVLATDYKLRREAMGAFTRMGGFRMSHGLALFVEATHLSYEERDAVLFAAYMHYAGTPDLRAALPWIGNKGHSERPAPPDGRVAARAVIDSLSRVRAEAADRGLERTLPETGTVSEEIIVGTHWEPSDSEWLRGVATDLYRHEDLKQKAATVLAVAEAAAARHPLRRVARITGWVLLIQPLIWMLVLLVYPWSRLAQWMVWT